MSRGCCIECGYKADYIIDKNNYEDNGYEDLDQVPDNKMLCGVCYESCKHCGLPKDECPGYKCWI